MAAPDDRSMNKMALENEPIANKEESKINNAASENLPVVNEEALNAIVAGLERLSITHEVASENHHVVDEEILNAIVAGLENLSITDEVASGIPSTTHAISRSERLGLLSLPSELRVHVFRYLLLEHRPSSAYLPSANYEPFPAILSTCRIIRREALQVL